MTSTRDKGGWLDPTLCPPAHLAHLAPLTPLAPGKNSMESSPHPSCFRQIQRRAQLGRRQHWHGHMRAWMEGEWERSSTGKGLEVAWCWRWTERDCRSLITEMEVWGEATKESCQETSYLVTNPHVITLKQLVLLETCRVSEDQFLRFILFYV